MMLSTFSRTRWPFYQQEHETGTSTFSGKMSIPILVLCSPFDNIWSLFLLFTWVLYIRWILAPYQIWFAHMASFPLWRLSFHFTGCPLAVLTTHLLLNPSSWPPHIWSPYVFSLLHLTLSYSINLIIYFTLFYFHSLDLSSKKAKKIFYQFCSLLFPWWPVTRHSNPYWMNAETPSVKINQQWII